MKTTLLVILALPLFACGPTASSAPRAAEGPGPLLALEPPGTGQSLYVVHFQDSAGKPLSGVKGMLLQRKPEPLFMREPRMRDRIAWMRSGPHGRVHFGVESDNLEKWFLITSDGFDRSIRKMNLATSKMQQEITLTLEKIPVATFLILGSDDGQVGHAVVTMKPVDMGIGTGSNVGFTERSDDSGEAVFTRRPGRYIIEANDEKGKGKVRIELDWKGNPEVMEIKINAPASG